MKSRSLKFMKKSNLGSCLVKLYYFRNTTAVMFILVQNKTEQLKLFEIFFNQLVKTMNHSGLHDYARGLREFLK